MPFGNSGGDVSFVDQRSPEMVQMQHLVQQLLTQFTQDPQAFVSSLGLGPQGFSNNPYAQQLQQPGLLQMLYGAAQAPLQFPADLARAPWQAPTPLSREAAEAQIAKGTKSTARVPAGFQNSGKTYITDKGHVGTIGEFPRNA